MKRSGSAVAVSLGAVWLCGGVAAFAQEAGESPLGAIVEVRSSGNDEAANSQKRIDTISDQDDDLLSQYRTALKQIDSIDIYNSQMRSLIAAQRAELVSLRDQLGGIQGVGRSVTPLMLRMVDAIEKFVELDVPFLIDERNTRIAALRALMSRADVTNP